MRFYAFLLKAFASAAAVLLGVLALLVTLDVVLRNVGLGTVAWVNEVSEYSLPVATLLIAPWLLHRNEHVRLDVVLASIPKTLARALERCCDVVGIAICAVFIWYSVRLILDSSRLGSMVVKTLAIPEWWQYALMPVCFSLLAVEFARRLRA
ncbi:MAG TPA: TRAP transporter small permease [Burkholderiales bacterium]|nr:TRAP transporter small permease [Burkholderiales bacterium]